MSLPFLEGFEIIVFDFDNPIPSKTLTLNKCLLGFGHKKVRSYTNELWNLEIVFKSGIKTIGSVTPSLLVSILHEGTLGHTASILHTLFIRLVVIRTHSMSPIFLLSILLRTCQA